MKRRTRRRLGVAGRCRGVGEVVGRHLRPLGHVQAQGNRPRHVWVRGPAGEHDRHRLWIDGDVPLGGGRRVARRAVGAGHHHQAVQETRQLRLTLERDGEVGEWPER